MAELTVAKKIRKRKITTPNFIYSVLGWAWKTFIAGPYNVHYKFTHVCGNSGGNTADMIESIKMMNEGKLNPTSMITHVGGLDSAIDTVINLDKIPGGKKLIYNFISMPLVALNDLAELGKENPLYAELAKIVEANNGMWSSEAEKYLLANAKPL